MYYTLDTVLHFTSIQDKRIGYTRQCFVYSIKLSSYSAEQQPPPACLETPPLRGPYNPPFSKLVEDCLQNVVDVEAAACVVYEGRDDPRTGNPTQRSRDLKRRGAREAREGRFQVSGYLGAGYINRTRVRY